MGLVGDYIVGEQSHFRVLKVPAKRISNAFCVSITELSYTHARTQCCCCCRHKKPMLCQKMQSGHRRSSLNYDFSSITRSHVKHELHYVEPRPWMCGDKQFAPYAARRSCLYRLSGFAPRASLFNVFLFKWERLSVSHDFSTRASGEEL